MRFAASECVDRSSGHALSELTFELAHMKGPENMVLMIADKMGQYNISKLIKLYEEKSSRTVRDRRSMTPDAQLDSQIVDLRLTRTADKDAADLFQVFLGFIIMKRE